MNTESGGFEHFSNLKAFDLRHMRHALALARRGLGRVWPNPSVGCVIVAPSCNGGDGVVVGRGWTQPSGRPHGETQALLRSGSQAANATAYVSLEPCAHWGETSPCALSLIEAGVKRVVVAMIDPDPRVSGEGIAMLREKNIDVDLGVCEAEARALNAGFISRVEKGRPLVTLKLATTLDGRIATHRGESKWITGKLARRFGHGMRARHDAIIVGSGTALSDDPHLNCRLKGMEDRSPLRVVIDSRLRLPLTNHLVSAARNYPTLLATRKGGDESRLTAYRDCGLEIIECAVDKEGNLDLEAVMMALGAYGLTRVLVEGGSRLSAAFFYKGLVDELAWFRSPCVIGGDGLPAAAPFGVDLLGDSAAFTRTDIVPLKQDILETYIRRA